MDMKTLNKVSKKKGFIYGPTFFLLYINNLPDVISNIAIYADDTIPCSKYDQTSDQWQQL